MSNVKPPSPQTTGSHTELKETLQGTGACNVSLERQLSSDMHDRSLSTQAPPRKQHLCVLKGVSSGFQLSPS